MAKLTARLIRPYCFSFSRKIIGFSAFLFLAGIVPFKAHSQVKMGANPSSIHSNSILEPEPNSLTGKYGFRLPRVRGAVKPDGFYFWSYWNEKMLLATVINQIEGCV